MATQLYHKDVFAPRHLFEAPGPMRVRYTRHAIEAAHSDRFGDLTKFLNGWVDIYDEEVVEVEVVDGSISKRVVRQQVTADLDLVLVITSDNTVKTVWGNHHKDKHATLNKSKFEKGIE